MKVLLLIFLLLAPLIGQAGAIEDAVKEAFRDIQLQPHHDIWEYGGIIVERNGGLWYPRIPLTIRKEDTLYLDIDKLKGGDKLVGLYHTHPCLPGYWTGFFSLNDLIQENYWKVPSFVLDQCTGRIHGFYPGDKVSDTGKVLALAGDKKMRLPAGKIVGHL